MARKPVPADTQAAILAKSRRRCCICYGLSRNTAIQQGQIAHLDKNPENNAEDNLAFLCFNHHDQYDSITRQSKNFTILEVKTYLEELYQALDLEFNQHVSFRERPAQTPGPINGHYIRMGTDNDSAEIMVLGLPDGSYHITGTAYWGLSREFGPNMGLLDFLGEFVGNTIQYTWKLEYDDDRPPKVDPIKTREWDHITDRLAVA